MSQYQGKHRVVPARGRHRVWPDERAVASLLGASTALTAGALAAIFLSGAAAPPDDYAIGPSPDHGRPITSEPGRRAASPSGPGSSTDRSLDLIALLSPSSDNRSCSSCGGGLTGLLTGLSGSTSTRSSSGGYATAAPGGSTVLGGIFTPGSVRSVRSAPSGGGTTSGAAPSDGHSSV